MKTNSSEMKRPTKAKDIKPWLEDQCGEIEWDDKNPNKGYLECPGIEFHTEPGGPKDCAVFINGTITLTCFHVGCAEYLAKCNKYLRGEMRKNFDWKPPKATPEQIAARQRRAALKQEAQRLEIKREEILKNYAWSVDEIKAASAPITNQWHQFLELWEPGDILWSGTKYDSSAPKHLINFKPVEEWAAFDQAQHPLISTCTYPAGCYERQKDKITHRRFLTVECDNLSENPEENKNLSGAILRWLVEVRGWDLAMVVDSGNKSIHGHFRFNPDHIEWAEECLPALGADPGPMRPAQPVRAPGFIRENGKEQALLWIQ